MSDCVDKGVTYDNIEKGDPVSRSNVIPVKWIKEWADKKVGYYHAVANRLIEDWEKSHENQD